MRVLGRQNYTNCQRETVIIITATIIIRQSKIPEECRIGIMMLMHKIARKWNLTTIEELFIMTNTKH